MRLHSLKPFSRTSTIEIDHRLTGVTIFTQLTEDSEDRIRSRFIRVHPHTSRTTSALSTLIRLLSRAPSTRAAEIPGDICWRYVPTSTSDRLLAFGPQGGPWYHDPAWYAKHSTYHLVRPLPFKLPLHLRRLQLIITVSSVSP